MVLRHSILYIYQPDVCCYLSCNMVLLERDGDPRSIVRLPLRVGRGIIPTTRRVYLSNTTQTKQKQKTENLVADQAKVALSRTLNRENGLSEAVFLRKRFQRNTFFSSYEEVGSPSNGAPVSLRSNKPLCWL